MKLKISNDIRDTKDIIFDILTNIGVEKFEISFDGSGDSGQVDEPQGVVPKKAAKKFDSLLEEKVEGARISDGTRYGPNGSEQIWKEDACLKEMIENVCYETLEGVCGGWEINEGSYGCFVFDVKKRKVHLEFNERVIECNLTEYDF